ncbi:MAG: hypothetical protein SFZ23_06955 [Planctomycetota bacterium]|nr:hypothetical protein [Planctomycetota bacterium]
MNQHDELHNAAKTGEERSRAFDVLEEIGLTPAGGAAPDQEAAERFSHALLEFRTLDTPAEQERRVRAAMAAIADPPSLRLTAGGTLASGAAARDGGRLAKHAAARARSRSMPRRLAFSSPPGKGSRRFGLASSLAATLAIGVFAAMLATPTRSSASEVLARAIATSRAEGDRRFEVSVRAMTPGGLKEKVIGTLDVRDAEHLLFKIVTPHGTEAAFGRDATGEWAITPEGRVVRPGEPKAGAGGDAPMQPGPDASHERGEGHPGHLGHAGHGRGVGRGDGRPGPRGRPRWLNLGESSIKIDSLEQLLTELGSTYRLRDAEGDALARANAAALEWGTLSGREPIARVIVGSRVNAEFAEPDRVTLWIGRDPSRLERLEMSWSPGNRPERGSQPDALKPDPFKPDPFKSGSRGRDEGKARPPGPGAGPMSPERPPHFDAPPPPRHRHGPRGGRPMDAKPGGELRHPEGMAGGPHGAGPGPVRLMDGPPSRDRRHPPPPQGVIFRRVESVQRDSGWYSPEAHAPSPAKSDEPG